MKKYPVFMWLRLLPIVFVCFIAGCATSTDKYHNLPAKNIYHTAKTYLEKGSTSSAIEAYESLSTQYPFGQYSQKADLEIIYAYYADGESAMALAAANSFIKLYPKNPHLDYALYMRGVLNFNAGRGFIQKYFPYHMQEHDPTEYTLAFNDFKQLVLRYPNSVYLLDARRRMVYLANILGAQQLMIAKFYEKKAAYDGAIARAMNVILHYPQTTAVKGALQVVITSYQALGLDTYAKAYQKVYAYNFPAVVSLQPSSKVGQPKNKA